jgi:hypothetical protein
MELTKVLAIYQEICLAHILLSQGKIGEQGIVLITLTYSKTLIYNTYYEYFYQYHMIYMH